MSIGKVIDRLTRAHPELSPQVGDVIAWSLDTIEEAGAHETLEHFHLVIKVEKGQARLPENVYRVESVGLCDTCATIPHTINGGWIRLHNANPPQVHVRGTAIPVDEQGYPMVDPLLVDACYWHVLVKLKESEWISGQYPENKYQHLLEMYEGALQEARGSIQYLTRGNLKEMSRRLRTQPRTR